MKDLFSLAEEIRKCTACPLHKNRLLTVPGEGPQKAKIMFVGEAPGSEEDRQGLPFVGRSGKFLDEMLKIADLERKDIFITGSVKCHPPKNRNPTAKELKTCKKWLDQQIKLIEPQLIVVLGRVALKNLLDEDEISKLHGKLIEKKYFVTYHPAAGMRFPKIKKLMISDFRRLKKMLMSI